MNLKHYESIKQCNLYLLNLSWRQLLFGSGMTEHPMRMTVDSTRDCVHEHLQGSSMGPDKEASTLSTGSWHSSDCLSVLTVLMPSKRQYRHRKTRQWESQPSQRHSKWNGAGSQNKPSPLCCFVGGGCFITATGMELTRNTRQRNTEPHQMAWQWLQWKSWKPCHVQLESPQEHQ